MAYQVSIFLENKLGQLEKVTAVLREADVNIRSVHLNHTANGWGILNLVVSDPERALTHLNASGLTAALRRIAAVRMADRPGSLDELLKRVVDAGVNFENAYGITTRYGSHALFVIDVHTIPDAASRLIAAGLEIVEDRQVYEGAGN